jgi:CheY-like chemotaxis protein
MTSDELRRIFDAFSQGDHANDGGSMRFGGLGLGLAITRMLVDLHRGQIRAASAGRGHGATFSIELPLVEEGERAAASPSKTIQPPASATQDRGSGPLISSLRILLVEDHEPTRTALSSLLGRRKHQVTAAGSLAEARALFAPGKFDLIISDIGLPDGNGYELMSEWREVPGLKGIALSGYGMEHDVSRSWEAGFSSHLTKPVKMETLDNAIAEAMAK